MILVGQKDEDGELITGFEQERQVRLGAMMANLEEW